MFSFLAYIFKIIISIGVGYIIGYSYKNKSKLENFQLYSSLSCFSVAAIIGLLIGSNDIFIGIVFLAIIQFSIIMNKQCDYNLLENYKILFSIINGFIIGMGYIFYSIIITLLFSYIVNNYDIISSLLASKKSIKSEDQAHEEKK